MSESLPATDEISEHFKRIRREEHYKESFISSMDKNVENRLRNMGIDPIDLAQKVSDSKLNEL
jgi:hypothetical protein